MIQLSEHNHLLCTRPRRGHFSNHGQQLKITIIPSYHS